ASPMRIDADTRRVLDRYGFDLEEFEELRARVASGELSPESNRLTGRLEAPDDEDLTPWPEPGSALEEEARARGLECLRAGEVAQVVLAGGMATRFGGVVKAVLEALDGKSFLEVKLEQTEALRRKLETEIPVALMTSFATDAAIRAHLRERRLREPLLFHQFVSLRLERDGSLFRGADGRPSLYAPGHGDLYRAIRSSGVLGELRSRGVRVVWISNVDNVGARVDPLVVGMHLLEGRPLTCEVARKEGDMGGAPVRVDGRLRIVEGPCFPPGFDQRLVPVFNTNTALFDLVALDRDYDLTWLYVEKTVEGRPAVQLERLYHEVTATVPTTYLVVPRRGPRGRFLPIKTPADLERALGDLRALVSAPVC
ncbi:MAG: UTP--glucose-1-phosphate uridylyltransferase, partial [Gaiellaceae bacterium]|nr:UTP--glucose-1-phosphate uridylyltransferase [Gaiellaceae bacterium]